MYYNKSVLAVVPARGGSKGIPLKNIEPLLGQPLITWTGNLVSKLDWIDRTVVSTDHADIANIAKKAGLEVPFMRPESLSGDTISDWDVLHHALREMEKTTEQRFDIVLMLQPTSPLRQPQEVTETVETLITGNFDSVWTVSETASKNHPLKQLTIKEDLLSFYDDRGSEIIARQQLSKLYHRNGVCYAFTRACLLDQRTIKGEKSGAVVLEGKHVSIDTVEDLRIVEKFLKESLN